LGGRRFTRAQGAARKRPQNKPTITKAFRDIDKQEMIKNEASQKSSGGGGQVGVGALRGAQVLNYKELVEGKGGETVGTVREGATEITPGDGRLPTKQKKPDLSVTSFGMERA